MIVLILKVLKNCRVKATKKAINKLEKKAKRGDAGQKMEDQSWWETPLKYFFHGISFSILLLVLGFLWIMITAVLVVFGYVIGLIIGFVVLLIFVGGLNSFLSDFFWDISTSTDWKSLLGHGFILFFALLIVDIPVVLINLYVPSLATTIVLFIIYAFISGFIARKVASYWETYHED